MKEKFQAPDVNEIHYEEILTLPLLETPSKLLAMLFVVGCFYLGNITLISLLSGN